MSTIGESAAMGTAGVVIWERSEMKLEVNGCIYCGSFVKLRNFKQLGRKTAPPGYRKEEVAVTKQTVSKYGSVAKWASLLKIIDHWP